MQWEAFLAYNSIPAYLLAILLHFHTLGIIVGELGGAASSSVGVKERWLRVAMALALLAIPVTQLAVVVSQAAAVTYASVKTGRIPSFRIPTAVSAFLEFREYLRGGNFGFKVVGLQVSRSTLIQVVYFVIVMSVALAARTSDD